MNLGEEGVYPITYIAKDYARNVTTVSAQIAVRPKVYEDNAINALEDNVLAKIITSEMSSMDKARAMYDK